MRIIVITPEEPRADEAEMIVVMLEMGVDRVHLRHPKCSKAVLRNIIGAIPFYLRERITIHDYFELSAEFPTIGLNLNARNPELPEGTTGVVSRSCHTVDETLLPADYALLSPIFPSISKEGYSHEFSETELQSLPEGKVIALGGITPERIDRLKRYPFGGFAVLGSVWNKNTDRATILDNVAAILKKKL